MDVRSVFNEYYCHDISRKVKMTFEAKKENNDYSCRKPPFGYRWNADKTGWVIEESEASAVRDIFNKYVSGKTLKSIGTEIEKCHCTHRSNWDPAAVWQILHNPVYFGYLVSRKYETKQNPYGQVCAVPRSEWELHKGTHKAIVKGDKWEHFMRTEMESLQNGRVSHKGKRHMFHGLTKCGDCGRALSCGRHDKQMLCCNHCSGHEEKRIETGRLFEVCLSAFYAEYETGKGIFQDVLQKTERELFLHHFIRRIDVSSGGDISIYWVFRAS